MRVNGSKKQALRRVVKIDNARYVVLYQNKRRMVLYRLEGDFSDFRLQLGYAQAKMAELLGISQATLSKMENGIVRIKPDVRRKAETLVRRAK